MWKQCIFFLFFFSTRRKLKSINQWSWDIASFIKKKAKIRNPELKINDFFFFVRNFLCTSKQHKLQKFIIMSQLVFLFFLSFLFNSFMLFYCNLLLWIYFKMFYCVFWRDRFFFFVILMFFYWQISFAFSFTFFFLKKKIWLDGLLFYFISFALGFKKRKKNNDYM